MDASDRGAGRRNSTRRSAADDADPLAGSVSPGDPVALVPGATSRSDVALLRLCRAMTAATVRAGNAQQPPLTAVQIRTMTALAGAGEQSLGDLARSLNTTMSATSRVCARLVRDGSVHRGAGPGNEIRLSLTPAGAKLLAAVNEFRLNALWSVLDTLNAKRRTEVLRAAEAFAEATLASAEPLW